jgi:hypothetical protein
MVPAIEAFDPVNPIINDTNAVVIAIEKITPYLDASLKALGLHTEARSSFITYASPLSHFLIAFQLTLSPNKKNTHRYWLPSLLTHKYIALRFLPQASYEQAAPLSVSPTPDIVTRLFMIFQGVDESDLEVGWSAARVRVDEVVSSWVDIVGVDIGRTIDKRLFRVVEWGGMEVFQQRARE